MARGELFASVLFTESAAGSDLAALTTTAEPRPGGGYLLNGRKRYSLKSHLADYGLCLARTGQAASRYQQLTLFLVPLSRPGVRVRRLPSIADEAFHDIEFTDVHIDTECVVGAAGEGWSLLHRSLAVERTGLDYYVRADYWLAAAAERARTAGLAESGEFRAALGRLRTRVEASRWLALKALRRTEAGQADERLSAIAKWYCSETAQQVAWWITETLGLESCVSRASEHVAIAGGLFEAAYREAPGMTISAGASEVLLDCIAGALS
jgi:alkylation response protein AidB-like acyl-CoA dehydrogenase